MTPNQFGKEVVRFMIVSFVAVMGLFGFVAATGPVVRSFALAMGAGW